MFLTSLKQTCNEYLNKFSENQSAPKLENRKTSPCSPCAPNLLHVLLSWIVGWHNLCSPVHNKPKPSQFGENATSPVFYSALLTCTLMLHYYLLIFTFFQCGGVSVPQSQSHFPSLGSIFGTDQLRSTILQLLNENPMQGRRMQTGKQQTPSIRRGEGVLRKQQSSGADRDIPTSLHRTISAD